MMSRRGLLVAAGVAMMAVMVGRRGDGESPAPDPLAADPAAPGRTQGFATTVAAHPWGAALGRTCGQVITLRAGARGMGSCVLLDRFGTVAMTAHQVDGWLRPDGGGGMRAEAVVAFSPAPGQRIERHGLEQVRFHPELDLALATIDPTLIDEGDLYPVTWGTLPAYLSGTRVVAVGWANGENRLHAVAGWTRRFLDIDQEDFTSPGRDGQTGRFVCKVESLLIAHPGMSGGGVFLDGAFVGIDNANSGEGDVPILRFTPSWAVWDAYRRLYPDRAAEAKFAEGPRLDRQPMPMICQGDPARMPALR